MEMRLAAKKVNKKRVMCALDVTAAAFSAV